MGSWLVMNTKRWLLLLVLLNMVMLWFALNLKGSNVLPFFEKYSLMPQNSFHQFSDFTFGKIMVGWGLMLVIQVIVLGMSWLIMPGDRQWWTLVSLAVTPFIIRGIFAAIYEQLYFVFWTSSVFLFYLGVFRGKGWYWILASFTLAGAYLSAYNSYFLIIGLFLFLIFSSRYRFYLFTWKPYVPLIFLLVAALISIKTNFGHGFIPGSIADAGRSYYIQQISGHELMRQLSWQGLLLLPILFFGFWWVAIKYVIRIFSKPNQINAQVWFLLSFYLPMFVGYYVLLPFNQLHLDWLLPAYFTGIVILGKFIKLRWLKWHLGCSVVFYILTLIIY